MRKAELDTKNEKFADSFFEVEIFGENEALNSAHDSKILELEKENFFLTSVIFLRGF